MDQLSLQPVHSQKRVKSCSRHQKKKDQRSKKSKSSTKEKKKLSSKVVEIVQIKQNEGDNTPQLKFKWEEDKDFIFNDAPKLMKQLMFKQMGWRLFSESSIHKYQNKFYERPQILLECEIQTKFDDLMKDKSFATRFASEYDQDWLKRWLRRPISHSDWTGYIYVYHVAGDSDKKKNNKIMAFKIGRSVNAPKRIGHCEKENNEKYNTALIEKSEYYKHYEAIIHDYFWQERIIRDEIKDGKTEWFYKKYSDIERVIRKWKIYLKVVHNDKQNA